MPKRAVRADDLLRIVTVAEPQLHPDGSQVLFTRKVVSAKNKVVSNLASVNLDGTVTEWTQGEGGASNGRWSPDGNRIAFIGGRDAPGSQIYILSTAGGEARKLTSLPEGTVSDLRWSPDGAYIALLYRAQIPTRTDKAKKDREEMGLSEAPKEIDSIWYRLDGDGYFENTRFHLLVVSTESGETILDYAEATDGQYAYDWNPNSRELVVAHTVNPEPVRLPPNDQLFRLNLDGQAIRLAGLPTGQKSQPRWSPDGLWIAYAGDVHETDPWGTRNLKAYLVSADGGEFLDLTGATDHDLGAATLSDTKDAAFGATLEWAPDSLGLFSQIGSRGETQLGYIPLAGGCEILTGGHHCLGIGNVAGGTIAATYATAVRIAEIAVIKPELATGRWAPHVLTDLNHDLNSEVKFVEPEEFEVDGVHAWVLKPTDYLPPRRYPAVLQVHGGPHAAYGWAFFHELQLLAAQGYVVVYSNPRGSKGYGEAFCAAIRGDWGNLDWEDIQSVTRWMQAQPFVHPGQIGIMGGSYGGYMTNWAIGHSDAYRVAITDRCVSNMVSMAGNSDFPFNKDGYFKGNAWGGIEEIRELWRQSPIAYFDNVNTPTLIIHSEGDLRCNVEQSEQVFCALQMRGVPSRFVRYPSSTFHGMSRSGPPDLRLHRLGEIVAWLDRWLK